MTHRFRLVPAVYVILRRRDHDGRREVLLQHRSGTGFMDDHWACGAAGHVEGGESVFAAAVREVAEELGVRIHEEDLRPLTVIHRRHDDDEPVNQRADFYFACDTWSGEPKTHEPHKSSDLKWFHLDHLPEPVVPHEKVVLEGMRAGDLPHLLALGF